MLIYVKKVETRACLRGYNCGTKWMYFLIEDEELCKKYDDIWNKVGKSMKKELKREPIYHKKCLKAKIQSYSDQVTGFCDK